MTVTVETDRRYEAMEMHLFDENESRESALCGAASSAVGRKSVNGYLENRLGGHPVGTVCHECKTLVMPFAEDIIRDLEAEGLVNQAEEYRRFADTLARETGLEGTGG